MSTLRDACLQIVESDPEDCEDSGGWPCVAVPAALYQTMISALDAELEEGKTVTKKPQRVEMWRDSQGKLHETEDDAALADRDAVRISAVEAWCDASLPITLSSSDRDHILRALLNSPESLGRALMELGS